MTQSVFRHTALEITERCTAEYLRRRKAFQPTEPYIAESLGQRKSADGEKSWTAHRLGNAKSLATQILEPYEALEGTGSRMTQLPRPR